MLQPTFIISTSSSLGKNDYWNYAEVILPLLNISLSHSILHGSKSFFILVLLHYILYGQFLRLFKAHARPRQTKIQTRIDNHVSAVINYSHSLDRQDNFFNRSGFFLFHAADTDWQEKSPVVPFWITQKTWNSNYTFLTGKHHIIHYTCLLLSL